MKPYNELMMIEKDHYQYETLGIEASRQVNTYLFEVMRTVRLSRFPHGKSNSFIIILSKLLNGETI